MAKGDAMTKIYGALKGLFATGFGNGLSMGKTVFMLCFAHSVWTWFHGRDIPEHQFYLMVACLGYVATGKLGPLSKIKGLEFAREEKR
jgi:hypothetical protein